jgi:hypothetical protein
MIRVVPVCLPVRPLNGDVYNFEVEDLHSYAVGRHSVLVHNNNGAEEIFRGRDALRRHNEVMRSLVRDLKLTKNQAQQRHREIHGMGFTREEIREVIRALFGR